MLAGFFTGLRNGGVPVSIREYLDLLGALSSHVVFADADEFYYLSRALLVKDEKHFDKFDRDGDAMINLGEFHLLVNELGHTGNPTEIAETFEQLDADGRGALGFDAFLRWWSTH